MRLTGDEPVAATVHGAGELELDSDYASFAFDDEVDFVAASLGA